MTDWDSLTNPDRQHKKRQVSALFQELLESMSISGVFLMFAVSSVVLYEIGFRIGRWYQERTPEESEGPTGMIVGSILALMAFMLAITMGMATDRFDVRRGLVLEDANSIGTTYLRAGYRASEPLHIAPDTAEQAIVQLTAANVILDELWLIAEGLAKAAPESDMLALYIDSLNETIDLQTTRANAGLFVRVPETVLMLLFIGAVLSLGMVGFNAGLSGRRSPLTAIVMIVVLGAVITLIVDIDRPQGGTLVVSQRPMEQLAAQIGPPGE